MPGESINDRGTGHAPPAWVGNLVLDSAGHAYLPLESVMKDFAQDLPANEAKLIAAKQGPIAMSSFDAKITTPAWRTRPAWYVRATRDHMIDPNAEAQMAKRANAKLTSLDASHVAMLSKPKQVADVILTAAAAQPIAAM